MSDPDCGKAAAKVRSLRMSHACTSRPASRHVRASGRRRRDPPSDTAPGGEGGPRARWCGARTRHRRDRACAVACSPIPHRRNGSWSARRCARSGATGISSTAWPKSPTHTQLPRCWPTRRGRRRCRSGNGSPRSSATTSNPFSDRPGRAGDAAEELAALADELEDEALELSPASAVACSRLLGEPTRESAPQSGAPA